MKASRPGATAVVSVVGLEPEERDTAPTHVYCNYTDYRDSA